MEVQITSVIIIIIIICFYGLFMHDVLFLATK